MSEHQLEFDYGLEEKRQTILAKWKEWRKSNGIYEADSLYIMIETSSTYSLEKRTFIVEVDWTTILRNLTLDEACFLIYSVPEIKLHWSIKEIDSQKEKFTEWKP